MLCGDRSEGGEVQTGICRQLNFYLAVVDDLLRHPDDQPSIGLVICKEKNRVIVEYALRGTGTPIGISEYLLTTQLPDSLQGTLPSAEQIKAEFADGS